MSGRPIYDMLVVEQLAEQLVGAPTDPFELAKFLLKERIMKPKLHLEVVPGAVRGEVHQDDIVVLRYRSSDPMPRTAWRVVDEPDPTVAWPRVRIQSLTSSSASYAAVKNMERVQFKKV